VLKHVARLWGFRVVMESVDQAGQVVRQWVAPAPE
jgi:spore cortex formation protein SpoVR/YcgB (stage V sporulation)